MGEGLSLWRGTSCIELKGGGQSMTINCVLSKPWFPHEFTKCHLEYFLILIISLVMVQFMLPAVQRTLKRRYDLTDKDITGLNVAQGISLILALVLVGYFGNFRARKIRCIGIGMALTGR